MNNIKLLRRKPNPDAALRVVCLHHAAGSAAVYLNWQMVLPDFIELSAIQLPGRAQSFQLPPYEDIHQAAAATAEVIQNELKEPYVIFGHSLGTMLGFETIRYLAKNKMKLPLHFFASGLGAPNRFTPNLRRDLMSNEELTTLLATYDKGRIEQNEAYYQLLTLILPAAFADFKMHDTYIYEEGKPLPCPITAIAGIEDEAHNSQSIEAWRELTSKECHIKLFPGRHMFLMDNPDEFLRWFGHELTKLSKV